MVNFQKVCFSKTISRLEVKLSIHVYGISDDLRCCVTADILKKLLQQCLLFLAHLSRRLIGELLVYKGIRRPSVVRRPSVNIFK